MVEQVCAIEVDDSGIGNMRVDMKTKRYNKKHLYLDINGIYSTDKLYDLIETQERSDAFGRLTK